MIVKGTVGGSLSLVAIGCVEATDVAYVGGSGGMHVGSLVVRVVVSVLTGRTVVNDVNSSVCETGDVTCVCSVDTVMWHLVTGDTCGWGVTTVTESTALGIMCFDVDSAGVSNCHRYVYGAAMSIVGIHGNAPWPSLLSITFPLSSYEVPDASE